jgi:hypothetical protein
MWLIYSQAGVATIAMSSLILLALSIAAKPALARAARVPARPAAHRPISASTGFQF